MGNLEKLIPKGIKPGQLIPIDASWPDPQGKSYSESQKIIINDAINLGMTTRIPPPIERREILSATIERRPDGTTIVAIVKQPSSTDPESWHIKFYFLWGQFNVDLQVCHYLVLRPNNPLRLHWRFFTNVDDPVISIEDIEKSAGSPSRATAYAKELFDLLPEFGKLFKRARSGRPVDSGTPQHKRRELLDKAYQAISRDPRLTWNSAEINRITNTSKNAVINWRKSFLAEMMPVIKQLQQEGFADTEIARKLDTTPDLLKMYLHDAGVLKIN